MALLDIKIEDRVFCIQFGWGTVKQLNGWANYPIYIEFDNGKEEWYDMDGRFYDFMCPSLSYTEYTLNGFTQEKPEELPKIGQIVWVRDSEYENWTITYFRKYRIDKEDKYGTSPKNSSDSLHIDYYKFLTTVNPYE